MAEQVVQLGGHPVGFGKTARSDTWWVGPLLTFLGLSSFVVYSFYRIFEGCYYYAAPYLSPFFSPTLMVDPNVAGAAPLHHAWFGAFPPGWPHILSPAFLVLPFPAAFRFTCYYYRKAYYRSFVGTPPACAVGALPQKTYRGETGLLIIQNLHRYALYFAILFVAILSYDAVMSYSRDGQLGIGVGSLVLTINPILIGLYTFGCHSFRHLVGGRKDCFSCDGAGALSHGVWTRVSWLNARHMLVAWMSLFWVAFSDVYVRLVSMGLLHDLNTWG